MLSLVRRSCLGRLAGLLLLAASGAAAADNQADPVDSVQNGAAAPVPGPRAVQASAGRLIQDQILVLAKDGDNRCADLRAASGDWCGQMRFELQRPPSLAGQTVRIWVDQPQRSGKAGQTATDQAAIALSAPAECKPVGTGAGIAIIFPADGACPLLLTAAAFAAGEYRANVRMRDPSGALDQSAALTLRAAAGPGTALLWLGIGALLGAIVAFLRNIFAPRASGLADALRQAQRFEMNVAVAEQSRLAPEDALKMLWDESKRIIEDARNGRGVAEERTAFAARVAALGIWGSLAHQARSLGPAALAKLRPTFSTTIYQIASDSDPAASLPALRTAVAAAISAQAGSESVEEANSAEAASGPVAVPDFSPLVLGGITRLEQLDRRTMLMSVAETAATFMLFAIAALLVIWVGNDSWGTVGDKLDALLIGAGAFLGSAAIKTMREAPAV